MVILVDDSSTIPGNWDIVTDHSEAHPESSSEKGLLFAGNEG